MIPKIIHRVIPAEETPLMKKCFDSVKAFHEGWELMTHYDQGEYEYVGNYLHLCPHGALRADLIRLETLYKYGGIYLDSDVEIIKPLDSFLNTNFFAVYENEFKFITNAVIGAEPRSAFIKELLDLSLSLLSNNMLDENRLVKTNSNVKAFGPYVFTQILKNYKQVKIYSYTTFFPYAHNEIDRASEDFTTNPNVYGIHRWAKSWVIHE